MQPRIAAPTFIKQAWRYRPQLSRARQSWAGQVSCGGQGCATSSAAQEVSEGSGFLPLRPVPLCPSQQGLGPSLQGGQPCPDNSSSEIITSLASITQAVTDASFEPHRHSKTDVEGGKKTMARVPPGKTRTLRIAVARGTWGSEGQRGGSAP